LPEIKYSDIGDGRNGSFLEQHANLSGQKVLKKPWHYLSLSCTTKCASLYRISLNAAVWYEFHRRHGRYNRNSRTHEQSLIYLVTHATTLSAKERDHIMKAVTRLLAQVKSLVINVGRAMESLNTKQRYVISQEAATIWFSYLDAKVYQNNEPWKLEETLVLYRDIFLSKIEAGIFIADYRQRYPNDTITRRTPSFFVIERDIKALLGHARSCVAELFNNQRGMYFGTLTGCPFFAVLPDACDSTPPWDTAVELQDSFTASDPPDKKARSVFGFPPDSQVPNDDEWSNLYSITSDGMMENRECTSSVKLTCAEGLEESEWSGSGSDDDWNARQRCEQ
jgi:hypothetical protein